MAHMDWDFQTYLPVISCMEVSSHLATIPIPSSPVYRQSSDQSDPNQGADNPVTAAKGCLSALSTVPYSAVKACAWVRKETIFSGLMIISIQGAEGNALMHAIANRTEGLNPAHKYVPWIVVDGVHTEEVKQKAKT